MSELVFISKTWHTFHADDGKMHIEVRNNVRIKGSPDSGVVRHESGSQNRTYPRSRAPCTTIEWMIRKESAYITVLVSILPLRIPSSICKGTCKSAHQYGAGATDRAEHRRGQHHPHRVLSRHQASDHPVSQQQSRRHNRGQLCEKTPDNRKCR
jgi:hypothetical protein